MTEKKERNAGKSSLNDDSSSTGTESSTKKNQSVSSNQKYLVIAFVFAAIILAVFYGRYLYTPLLDNVLRKEAAVTIPPQSRDETFDVLLHRIDHLENALKQSRSYPSVSSDTHGEHAVEFTAQLDSIMKRIDHLENRLTAYETHQKKLAHLYSTFEELNNAWRHGRPFEEYLNSFAGMVENYTEFSRFILELSEYAAAGIPSIHQLETECRELIKNYSADTATSLSSANIVQKWWHQCWQYVRNLVRIYKTDDNQVLHALNVMDAMHQALECLQQDNAQEAFRALQPYLDILDKRDHRFLSYLKARAVSEQALHQMETLLASPRIIQLLITPH